MVKLTERQRLFVQHYTGNATEAARLAGYKSPEVEGCRLLKNAKVVSVLTTRVQVQESNAGITRAQKKERLKQIIEGEDDKLAMQAIDIDNKMQAEYIQKHEVTHNFQDKTDDEVLADVIADLEARGYKVVPPK